MICALTTALPNVICKENDKSSKVQFQEMIKKRNRKRMQLVIVRLQSDNFSAIRVVCSSSN